MRLRACDKGKYSDGMPQHPAPPDDRAGLLDAFEQCIQAIIDLGWACREEDFAKPSECEGWTVKDHISHAVGAEKALASTRRVSLPLGARQPIVGDIARFIEVDVESRRQWPGRDIVSELADFHLDRMAETREVELEIDDAPGGLFGAYATFGDLLRRFIIDVWIHEQDIRFALDRPGDLDSAGAAVFTAAIFDAVPDVVVRVAGDEPGCAVVFDVTGPVLGRSGARVVIDPDGKPFAEPLFRGLDRPEGELPDNVTTIQLTTEALTRRAAGRRPTDVVRYTASGDEDLARRVLDALAIVS